ncbi:MAG: glycosyltransferase, partial [Chloroflexota bacterium]|nr:glycosyltransferase [Chloroflexota bacterium]
HGHRDTQATYERLLHNYLNAEEYHDPILWLYTPMAADFAKAIPHKRLIYDVMDELSAFKGAPAALKAQERQMLQQADVVFTGGVSLYRAKLGYNANTHLFSSGVETAHFLRAAQETFAPPPDLPATAAPVLGYFGVIDERMDLPLLTHLAAAHPEWTILMLGPVLKIDPVDLPQAPNLHFLGMKQYHELPAYLAHFDVALVPFAMNEATRHLSPTKTLEYMAAHKPVVSTPIPDIVELYGDYVRIAGTPQEFVAQVEAALTETADQRTVRLAQEESLLERYSWDSIAAQMHEIIEESFTVQNNSSPLSSRRSILAA